MRHRNRECEVLRHTYRRGGFSFSFSFSWVRVCLALASYASESAGLFVEKWGLVVNEVGRLVGCMKGWSQSVEADGI